MSSTVNTVEELRALVEQLEQQVETMHDEFAALEEQFDGELAELDEEMEAVAEEALLAGYELGYLQSTVKMVEKQVFLAEAANTFDEIMIAPELLDVESIEDLVEEIDAFDEELDFELDEDEEIEEQEALFEDDEEKNGEAVTASEVAAAIRNWVGGHTEVAEATEQEELALVED
jgi:hypothetical protein